LIALQGGGQAAGIEHLDEEIDFRLLEVAGDLPERRDRALDGGRRLDHVVEQNREAALQAVGRIGQVAAREQAEPGGPVRRERELHARGEVLVDVRAHA